MFAAVDLGSNSFRLHIGHYDGNNIRIIKSARDPIRLGAGLDADGNLTLQAMRIAAESLARFATVLGVATPIKIWNNARIEHRLQEQEKLLMAAKVEALKSQINPHFLFNTLASVSSLIRSQPETARTVIQKLSG